MKKKYPTPTFYINGDPIEIKECVKYAGTIIHSGMLSRQRTELCNVKMRRLINMHHNDFAKFWQQDDNVIMSVTFGADFPFPNTSEQCVNEIII